MAQTINTGFITNKINGITINTSLKCNASNYTNATDRNISYIVMHYTGNSKDTAKANANYFTGANREASAHFFVDDTSIYQSVELRDVAWHCGTKGTYYHKYCRNNNSIGIEMCCTAGNYKISSKTQKNAAYLCAEMCRTLGITAGQVDTYVLRHYDVTHKMCPAQMAGGANKEWTAFKQMVKDILSETTTSTHKTTTTSVDFKVGEQVKLTAGAVYTNGKTVPTWVIGQKLYVRKINNNGNITVSLLKIGAITGVVNKKYLQKITSSSFKAYKIKITVDALNIRAGAGTNYKIVDVIRENKKYTIVEEKNGFGRLK
jgi:N-acetylmuramoyl-L-alanine amidase CwlA